MPLFSRPDPAALKARFDAKDPSPTVCRCEGAPAPLEPTGPHCARCRRMFSAELRRWLTGGSQPSGGSLRLSRVLSLR